MTVRVAVIHHGTPSSPALASLGAALQRNGLAAGDDCILDAAGADCQWASLPNLIGQLLDRGPDVLVAIGALAALAAQRATADVPVLYAIVLDPRDIGLTARHVSGVTTFDRLQATRHLQLLRQLVPGLRRVACFGDADAPTGGDGRSPLVANLLHAGAAQGVAVTCVTLGRAHPDLGAAFGTLRRSGVQALVALEVPAVLARLRPIGLLAEQHGLPTLFPFGRSEPGLVMQGAALHDAIDPLAASVAAVARGAKVADLPVQAVREERLVLHLGRARSIGLAIPEALLAQASHFIDAPNKLVG